MTPINSYTLPADTPSNIKGEKEVLRREEIFYSSGWPDFFSWFFVFTEPLQ